MKLTPEQKKALAALLLKDAATLTADEKTTLTDLQTKALAEGITLDAAFTKEFGPAQEVTPEELTTAIEKAVNTALQGKGFDTSALLTEIKGLIPKDSPVAVTAEQIEGLITKHAPKIDNAALLLEVKSAIAAANPAVTKAQMDAAIKAGIEEGLKSHRAPSSHQFPVSMGGAFPITHRSGNLSVAQKQLLNICLMSAAEEAIVKGKSVRPAHMNDGIDAKLLSRAAEAGDLNMKGMRDQIVYGTKALTTGSASNGLEFMPADLSSELQMRLYLDSKLAAALLASEIVMPSDPFKLPLKTTRTTFYLGSEAPGTDPTASNPGSAAITLTTSKLIGVAEYSYEADEDAILAILPMLMEDLASGGAYAFETAVINGDTTNPHMDLDTTYTTAAEGAFKGLRKLCLAGSSKKDLTTNGVCAANIAAMRKQMKKWGVSPKDLLLLVGPSGYNDIVNLSETLTYDKVGNPEAARILTGVAAQIYGIPVVVSEAMREDLNIAGVYDQTTSGSVNTKGSIVLMHRPSFVVGSKRGFTVEVETLRRRQINAVIASFRRDFQPKETISTTIPLAVLGYNYTA